MTLSALLNLNLNWNEIVADSAGRNLDDRNGLSLALELTDGTGVNQANKLYYERRTLTASSTHDYDVAGGLTDRRGATITMAKLKGLIVVNYATTANYKLVVGGHPTAPVALLNAPNDAIICGPGGWVGSWNPSAAGFAVVAGVDDVLRIQALNGSVTYDIAILGSS